MSVTTGYSNSRPDQRALERAGFKTYREYLTGDHWKAIRSRYFASKEPRRIDGRVCCQICRATDKPLELHHRTYKRLGFELLMDLIAVCRDCHQRAHDYHRAHRKIGLWKAAKLAWRQHGKGK